MAKRDARGPAHPPRAPEAIQAASDPAAMLEAGPGPPRTRIASAGPRKPPEPPGLTAEPRGSPRAELGNTMGVSPMAAQKARGPTRPPGTRNASPRPSRPPEVTQGAAGPAATLDGAGAGMGLPGTRIASPGMQIAAPR